MQIKTKILFVLCFGFVLFSCHNTTDTERAAALINEANRLVEAAQYNSAKLKLDSVHLLYPKQVSCRRQAKHLSDSIVYLEALKTAHYCDSLLQIVTPKADSLTRLFKYEKNNEYEDYGKYTHRLLLTGQNTDRCFLQTQVAENLHLVVKSFYVGQKQVRHTAVQLSAGDNYQQASGSLHSFTVEQAHEILTIEGDEAEALLQFADGFRKDRIKVELLNDSKKTVYTYYLMPNEKQSLADTYQLFVTMRDLKQLEQLYNTANRQISYFLQKNEQ